VAVLPRREVVARVVAGLGLSLALGCMLAASPRAALAQDWLISVLDGEAVVMEGTRRVAAAAGQRLEPGAIIETSGKTLILRLEGGDQSTYDLGPDTRAMLAPPGFAARNDRPPQVYLMQGWLKGTARGSREAAGILTPALEVMPFKGAVVLQQQKREHAAFVESGRIDVMERRVGQGLTAINAGEFYSGEGARRGTVVPRPAPAWAQTVPRPFRDPVPLRAQVFRDKRVEPGVLPGPTYAQLADWLTAEYTLRVQMPNRFAPLLARDAAFKAEINAHIAAHPEWGPLLDRENRAAQGNRRK